MEAAGYYIYQKARYIGKTVTLTVSSFCSELTIITQQLLDEQGVLFQAIEMLEAQYDLKEYLGKLGPVRYKYAAKTM